MFRYFVDEKPIWDNEKLETINIDNSIPQYTGGIIKVGIISFEFIMLFLYFLNYTIIYLYFNIFSG